MDWGSKLDNEIGFSCSLLYLFLLNLFLTDILNLI